MEKTEILNKMKALHAEYAELSQKLATLDGPENRVAFEKEQRRRLEAFKKELTVEATIEAKPIDWDDIEKKIFSQENLDQHLGYNPESWGLGYDNDGMPIFYIEYRGGGAATVLAYDKVDAERYVKRMNRKAKIAAKKNK